MSPERARHLVLGVSLTLATSCSLVVPSPDDYTFGAGSDAGTDAGATDSGPAADAGRCPDDCRAVMPPACADAFTRRVELSPSCVMGECTFATIDERCVGGCDGATGDCQTDVWVSMSTTGAPSPRVGHSAVWTGSEMIVWGGYDGTAFLDTGGRYDPVADTWTPVSTVGAPDPRYSHIGVWTGDRMLVMGGVRLTTNLNGTGTGAAYDPVTDTWADIPIAPSVRLEHTGVWTGAQLIVFGGLTRLVGTAVAASGVSFDGDWMTLPTSGAPADRWAHSVVWTGTEMIVWGGANLTSLTSGGARLLPVAGTWSPVFADEFTPRERMAHVAVWTGDEMIIWGGSSNETPADYYGDGGRYDPSSNRWARLPGAGAPEPRIRPVAAWTGQEMLIWGGGDADTPAARGGAYERATDTWRAIPEENQPAPRFGATSVWTGEELIVWGGSPGPDATMGTLNTGGRYVPPTPL